MKNPETGCFLLKDIIHLSSNSGTKPRKNLIVQKICSMAHKKEHLPKKVCPVCGLPFTWRKKWTKNWDNVKYCSERCRRNKKT
mmetsp:Transcript_41559/g.68152  ORF Transcript_41559/g.68152 Transcript_41559/m.68152 type:complete len:83 (+) Transcript_41559:132-380(+)